MPAANINKTEAFRIIETCLLSNEEVEQLEAFVDRLERHISDMECVLQDIHGLGCRWAEDRGGRMLTCYHLRHPERWCGACIAEAHLIGMSRNLSPEGR